MAESNVRVYVVAQQLGVPNETLLAKLREKGITVRHAADTISSKEAASLLAEMQGKTFDKKPSLKSPASNATIATETLHKATAPSSSLKTAPTSPSFSTLRTSPKPPAFPFQPKKSSSLSNAHSTPSSTIRASSIAHPSSDSLTNASSEPIQSSAVPKINLLTPKPLVAPSVSMPNLSRVSTEKAVSTESIEKKTLSVKPPLVLRELATLLNVKPFQLIGECMKAGTFVTANQVLEESIAQKIAEKHGVTLVFKRRDQGNIVKKTTETPQDESKFLEPRPPIVCILGHVDHGKTTLLDTIRKTRVAAKEAGGITQHIGAYQVEVKGKKITFLDTPGHAAFSKIRQRGATVTDIAILVVAADDGFMPQTEEALQFAQKENVPVVVAINKIDAKGANVDRVKQQMQTHGIAPEDWGGDTLYTEISALKGTNVDALLESVLLQAEMMELKANPKGAAEGVVIESKIEVGRGTTATVLIHKGTLKPSDSLVCGTHYCKARALLDENGKNVPQATPATPVQILGWSSAPESGASFHVVKNEKEARQEAEEASQLAKQAESSQPHRVQTVEELMAALDAKEQRVLRVILRGDVHGSVEALADCLKAIQSKKVTLTIVDAHVGQITLSDIHLAHDSQSTVVGFHTKLENGAQSAAKQDSVRILQHDIIYELIDQVTNAMRELLDPEWSENKLGSAEIRQVFMISKKPIAGCMVTEGEIIHNAAARLIRKGKILADTKISTLKRFKEDVGKVKSGYECGIGFDNLPEAFQKGDMIECYEKVSKLPDL